jgi:hypothetical protein
MSDFQLSLIVLGTLGVALVFAYNKWQERKHRKLAQKVFASQHADVLLGDGASEAEPAASAASPADTGAPERVEPSIGDVPTELRHRAPAVTPEIAVAPELPPRDLADASVDCVIRFESTQAIGGGYLWQAQRQALGKLTKPVFWVGLNEGAGVWELLGANAGGEYRRLCAVLQLVDRRGQASDAELLLFFNGVQRVADEFLAIADIPSRVDLLARAGDLDRFCADVDIQIGVNVIAGGNSFAGTKLRGLAEAAGLLLREDGMFHAADDAGRTLFTLANLEPALFAADELKVLTTQSVTFTLDVPRVADGVRAFERMISLARQFATSLGGSLVDDNRAPLAGSALDVIRDKIIEIEQTMAVRGIPAGGPQALKLFS